MIILASQSKYRKAQLKQLGIAFKAVKPLADEEALKVGHRKPRELATFLATAKALSLQDKFLSHIIIGCDQLVACRERILGKGHTLQKSAAQLRFLSGKEHQLITALCVLYKNKKYVHVDTTTIRLKKLSLKSCKSYVTQDKTYDCAGSYKIERAGISLVEKLKTQDPSSIQGIPLIALSKLLKKVGYVFPYER